MKQKDLEMSALCTTFSTVSIWSVTDIIFCHFMPFFAFAPLLTPKFKIWKKCTKTPGDIILLHMSTINQDRMMYGS